MIRLVYRPAAVADLEEIIEFASLQGRPQALRFVEAIRKHCRLLCDFPELGPSRPDIADGIRIFPMRRKVVVAYRINPDAIVVTRILHGRQDYTSILRRAGESDPDE